MAIAPADGQEYAKAIRAIYDEAERLILEKIAKRAAKGDSIEDPNHWLDHKLNEVRRHQAEIDRILKKLEKQGPEAIKDLIIQGYLSGVMSADSDLIGYGVDLKHAPITMTTGKGAADVIASFGVTHTAAINSIIAQAMGGLKGAHVQMIREAKDAYRNIIMETATSAIAGVETRQQATQRALNKFADRGIGAFVDKSGKTWDIATYAEMSTRTAMAQAHIQGHINRMVQQERDLVIVSDHPEESDLCRPHEGKVYSISGNHPTFKPLSWAIANGLFHPNCRHTINAYIEGLTEIPKAEGDPEGYETRQKQRYMERQVRAWKKRHAVAITPTEKAYTEGKIKEWQKALREFTRKHDRKRRYDREKIHVSLIGKGPSPTSQTPSSSNPAAEIIPFSQIVDTAKKEVKDSAEATPVSIPEPSRDLLDMVRGTDNVDDLLMWIEGSELGDEFQKFVDAMGGDRDKAHKHLLEAERIASLTPEELAKIEAKKARQEAMSDWERQFFELGPLEDVRINKQTWAKIDSKPHMRKHGFAKEDDSGNIVYDYDSYFAHTKKHLMKLLEDAQPTVRVSPRVLSLITNGDGRFKTQFETGTSNGLFSPEGRKKVEKDLFGAPYDLPDNQRPIYGLLDGSHGQTDRGRWYGSVKVRLKKDRIKDRTTISIGDSLDYGAAGMRITDPDTTVVPDDILSANDISKIHERSYTEFQVFGGVTLGDVERVDIVQYDISGPEIIKVLERLESMGIEVRIWNELDNGTEGKGIRWNRLQQFLENGYDVL